MADNQQGLFGQYRIWNTRRPWDVEIVPNNLMQEGAESLLKMALQADGSDVSAGGNFYLGLCGNVSAATLTLATLSGEPSAAGGYARRSLARNSTGWPTVSLVNNRYRALSAVATFAASGADFSTTFYRLFLCNASSGTAGILYSVSGALTTAKQVVNGESYAVQYELFLG